MRRQFRWVVPISLAFAFALVQAPGAAGEQGGNASPGTAKETAGNTAEVWVLASQSIPTAKMTLEVPSEPGYPAQDPIALECVVHSRIRLDKATVLFTVRNAEQDIMATAELTLDLCEGLNSCHFNWDSHPLPPGRYVAHFDVRHSALEDCPAFELTLKKVTAKQLKADLAAVTQRLEGLRAQLGGLEKDGIVFPHMGVRLAIAEDFAERARQDSADGDWRRLDATLVYLAKTADTIHVGTVFGSTAPELIGPLPRTDLASVEARDGGLYCGDRPVFLFGRVLDDPTPEALAQLARYKLNFAVFTIAPSATLSSPTDTADFQARFEPVFGEAEKQNTSLVVQLAPQDLGAWAIDAWPAVANMDFIDLTHEAAKGLFERHVRAVIPYLAGKRMLSGVSIATNPRFKFDGEDVHTAFIEAIRTRYPDRQELNRIWRTANLADYEEITIWGDYPEYSYQNQHPYQFEWQTFHHRLATEHLAWMKETVRKHDSGLPLMTMLPDTAFELAETRHGVDREAVAELMDIAGCSASTDVDDPYYALHYPRQPGFYTLIRSFAPAKPLLNLEDHIALGDDTAPALAYAYVRSVLWEAVMSGLNATALAPDTGVFDRPEALEAFALAGLEINRLAPIVDAFQQAPPDIAILFSRSSKIFDDGEPHLLSAWYAYEGCSFAGYKMRFITEDQCVREGLEEIKLLVIPQTPAVADDTFKVLQDYVEAGRTVARVGTPIPYNAYGHSRHDVIRNTAQTVLVRGMNLPTEYLHAVDAAIDLGSMPQIPRPINANGYPLEGVKTRAVEYDGSQYLYIVNLCKSPVQCYLAGNFNAGRDLIAGRDVSFPRVLPPLDPMLIRMEPSAADQAVVSSATPLPPEYKWWQVTAKHRAKKRARESATGPRSEGARSGALK